MRKLRVVVSDAWSDGENVRDYGSVLQVWHGDTLIEEQADTFEPEDASFNRDLSWVRDIIEKSYTLGLLDAEHV